jgi:uncharacterized membrane protein
MNLKDPELMNVIIGKVLRYGVLISAAVTVIGAIGLVISNGRLDTSAFINYNPGVVPHDGIGVSLSSLASGFVSFSPSSWVELGVILLIATPVSRVLISVLLFAAEKDRLYVVITGVVLTLLLFSMLVTPFIPGFHA